MPEGRRGYALKEKGSKTWRARWELAPDPKTGERRQRSKGGFRTRVEAITYANEQIAAVGRGINVDPRTTTVAQYAKLWLAGVKPELRISTWDWYRSKFDIYIVPAIGRTKLRDLTRDQIKNFYSELPPPIVDRVHRALRRMLYDAMRSDVIARNPAVGIKRPKAGRVRGRGMHVWNWEELHAFLEVAQEHHPALWRLIAGTGCRRGEVLGLFWADIDLAMGTVTFQRGLADPGPHLDETKTPAGRRTIDIDEEIVRALRAWKKRQNEDRLVAGPLWKSTVTLANGEELRNDLVFTRPDGSWIPPTKVGQAFHRLRERAGLRHIRLHDLRHTHATLLLKAGVNTKVVQERLGHESIAITLDLYGHVLPSMGREVADLVGRMLGPVRS